MMIKNKLLFLVIIFSTLASAQNNDLFSAENRLKFGDYLFRQKDYLRSAIEYSEVLKSVKNDTVKFKLAVCFDNMKKYDEAAINYKGLMFNSALGDLSKIYFLKNRFMSEDPLVFQKIAANPIYKNEKYFLSSEKLLRYSFLYSKNFSNTPQLFAEPFDKIDQEVILDFYNRRQNSEVKSEWTAGILSAIIPGAGKIYTEQYTDGITSFLLTGIFAYLAVDNLNDNHNTRGWIFTGLAAYFYAGNIYGSVASAQLFNAEVEFNLMEEINNFIGKKNYFLPDLEIIK